MKQNRSWNHIFQIFTDGFLWILLLFLLVAFEFLINNQAIRGVAQITSISLLGSFFYTLKLRNYTKDMYQVGIITRIFRSLAYPLIVAMFCAGNSYVVLVIIPSSITIKLFTMIPVFLLPFIQDHHLRQIVKAHEAQI